MSQKFFKNGRWMTLDAIKAKGEEPKTEDKKEKQKKVKK